MELDYQLEYQNVSHSTALHMFNYRIYLIFEAESSGTEETVGTDGSFELDERLPTRENKKLMI